MKKKAYAYEADWRQYAFPEQQCGFSTEEDLAQMHTPVVLEKGSSLEAGGLPVVSDGKNATVITENQMALIFGGTGSKKTRTLILPLISILAQAKESMVIMDIKGELSDGVNFPQIRGVLEANGYDCKFLNFRDMDSDGFNILMEPYRLYRAGQRDESLRMVNDLVESLASIYHDSKADPFWEMTAKLYLVAVTTLMFELCENEEMINMLSLASYTDWDSCEHMTKVADLINVENNIMTMLRSVTSEPEKTRMSTLATVNSMLTRFLTNEKLLKMLSHSTFELHDLYKRPTALFIIVPDEVDTYSGIVGLLLQQISATLVQDAYQLGGRLPRRVNMVCDEFCNMFVPGMARSISAHRSRNIRWYLVCQSMKQLEACYPKDAGTILANCTDMFFLNSPELSLLEYLSKRAGETTVTADGIARPILSVADLQGLKKGWTHTDVYYTSGNTHFVSAMPDISQYQFLDSYRRRIPIPHRVFPTPPVYSAARMHREVKSIRSSYDLSLVRERISETDRVQARRYAMLFKTAG